MRLIGATLALLTVLAGGPAAAQAARAAPANVLGGRQATVVVEEYGDFQCPYCAAHEMQFGAAVDRWVREQSGDVRFEFYDLALPQHPFGTVAARVARCAGAQGSFGAVRHALFAAQPEWVESAEPARRVAEIGRATVRDTARFNACLVSDSAAASATIAANLERARQQGVTATPTFIIRVGERSAQLVRAAAPDSMARVVWRLRNAQ
jgi:protein-disulfide isomerase